MAFNSATRDTYSCCEIPDSRSLTRRFMVSALAVRRHTVTSIAETEPETISNSERLSSARE
jgi:hypothetical protein